MKSRILVCGGRNFNDQEVINKTMNALVPHFDPRFCLIHGGCTGADNRAGAWARRKGFPVMVMEATWKYYGTSAGGIRNSWMLEYCRPDLVVAFPGGTGTANMVKLAKRKKVDVYEV